MQQDMFFSNLIWWKQRTDIQNKDNRHYHAHKHTRTEQTQELHSTKFVIFLLEISTFSALGVGSYFLKNITTSHMFRPECI